MEEVITIDDEMHIRIGPRSPITIHILSGAKN